MQTPVIFVAFNRPESTARLLETIRAQRPERLTVICDGPRPGEAGDRKKVAAVRELIDRRVDWPCELIRDYAEENLGCGVRVATGLTAAFARYDRAIVLEDDTLPDPSFFGFCEQMLDRYRDDPRVVHVNGTNTAAALGHRSSHDGYSFSRIPDIWGWATWSRAWQAYDHNAEDWPEVRQSGWLEGVVSGRINQQWWQRLFDRNHNNRPNPCSWATSWIYRVMRSGLAVTPGKNLVSNIGFGVGSTNCDDSAHVLDNMPRQAIALSDAPHPPVEPDHELESLLCDHRFGCLAYRRSKSPLGRLRHAVSKAQARATRLLAPRGKFSSPHAATSGSLLPPHPSPTRLTE